MSRIVKAEKKKSKLRVLLEGASGSGKTYSALLMAKAFPGKTIFIDTEKGSASLYADRFDFDVLELDPPYTPEAYIEAIHECEQSLGNEGVIIIDSISHEWMGIGGCLEIQHKLGGRYQDWAKVTPRHDAFVNTILRSPCHIICCCRTKQGYNFDETTKKVTKAGLDPQQRDGLDYEMTTVFSINQNHMAEVANGKDRTSIFDGKQMVITENTGKTFLDWLNSGVDNKPVENIVPNQARNTVFVGGGVEPPINNEIENKKVLEEESKKLTPFQGEMRKLKDKLGTRKFNKALKDMNVANIDEITSREKQIEIYKKLTELK